MLIASSGRRLHRIPPLTAPPGTLEQAVGLTLAHALPLRLHAQQVVRHHLLGEGGYAPGDSRTTGARFNIGSSRVNQLLREARGFAVIVPCPDAVHTTWSELTRPGVRYAADAVKTLVRRKTLERARHPVALARTVAFYGQGLPAHLFHGKQGAVLVPAGDRGDMHALRLDVVRRLERAIAVPVLTESPTDSRAVTELLRQDPLLNGGVATVRSASRGAPGGWVWRTWDPTSRGPGTAVRLVQRLLAVRPHRTKHLRTALVDALMQQPASGRAPSTDVAPVAVLEAWLRHVSATESALVRTRDGWTWHRPVHPVDRTVLAVLGGAGGHPLPTAAFLDALVLTGMSRASATQELLRTPLLRRTRRGHYVLRD